MARKCSNCGAEMQPETIHGVTLDACPRCGGTWLDADELRALMNSGPLAEDDLQHLGPTAVSQSARGSSTMNCPNDGSTLEMYHYMYNSPILLHACPKCGGFWIAPGEIEKMEKWRDEAKSAEMPNTAVAEAINSAQTEVDKDLRRSHNIANFFGVLDRYQPGWLGLL